METTTRAIDQTNILCKELIQNYLLMQRQNGGEHINVAYRYDCSYGYTTDCTGGFHRTTRLTPRIITLDFRRIGYKIECLGGNRIKIRFRYVKDIFKIYEGSIKNIFMPTSDDRLDVVEKAFVNLLKNIYANETILE